MDRHSGVPGDSLTLASEIYSVFPVASGVDRGAVRVECKTVSPCERLFHG